MQTNWEKLPLGKRKVEFVKWLMKKHKVGLRMQNWLVTKNFIKRSNARCGKKTKWNK
jgi:hypothetical protein